MTLTQRIAAAIQQHRRLRAVPPAVIEDVLAIGIDWLSMHVPMHMPASELSGSEFVACEGCGNLIDPDEPEGGQHDEEGIWLCNACVVESSPQGPGKGKEI